MMGRVAVQNKRLKGFWMLDSLRNYIVYPAGDDMPFSFHTTKEEFL
jgi:hypothetical protein